VKTTISDLDRLIRLEEFLREEEKVEGTKIILEWRDYDEDELRNSDAESDTLVELRDGLGSDQDAGSGITEEMA
jgi:hypothetical protein